MLRVKIANPTHDVIILLNALTDAWGLAEHLTWTDGYEGDDYIGPFIVLQFTKHEDKVRKAFRRMAGRGWCEIMD